MQAAKSLYRVLQVDPAAEDVVIHAAYRALMKRHHPDRGGEAAIAQRLNVAYGTLRDPRARQAYDKRAKVDRPPEAPRGTEDAPRGRHVTSGPSLSLMAELGPEFARRFTPVPTDGFGWIFDFTGTLRGSHHHRIWIKRVPSGDLDAARLFMTRVEAARLLRPLWTWHSDLFVAVVPHPTAAFRSILRGPRGPFARLTYGVVTLDLSGRSLDAIGRTAEMPTFQALRSAVQ